MMYNNTSINDARNKVMSAKNITQSAFRNWRTEMTGLRGDTGAMGLAGNGNGFFSFNFFSNGNGDTEQFFVPQLANIASNVGITKGFKGMWNNFFQRAGSIQPMGSLQPKNPYGRGATLQPRPPKRGMTLT